MSLPSLECRQLSPELQQPLADFFAALQQAGDVEFFHPHPLTPEEAVARCRYAGNDLHYVLVDGGRVLGYGLLRGWDEGFEIPSLGIAVHPACRRQKLGETLMHFLHAAARLRGASRVRLKAYERNQAALRLYHKMGYVFASSEGDQLVGYVDL